MVDMVWAYQKTKDKSDDKPREAHFNVEINLATK